MAAKILCGISLVICLGATKEDKNAITDIKALKVRNNNVCELNDSFNLKL